MNSPVIDRQPGSVRLEGDWNVRGLVAVERKVQRQLAQLDSSETWDLREVESLDTLGATILWRAWGRVRPAELLLRPEHEALFSGLSVDGHEPSQRRGLGEMLTDPFVQLGEGVREVLVQGPAMLSMLGRLLLDFFWVLRNPRRAPLKELSSFLYEAGARALPITALVGFLMGVVLAFLSSRQLEAYGVEAFIVDLVGIGVFRELGPLMAAMLFVGRTGSSITAQLGAMKLTQEIEAMHAMGISPTVRLVLPRVVGMTLASPLLAAWTSMAGVFGGMLVARAEIGMSFPLFLVRLRTALPLVDVQVGWLKALSFGLAASLVACHFGLRAEANTSSLGSETTRSVVVGLVAVILLDALFAVLFRGVGSS